MSTTPLLTTIPDREMMPIMVIRITKGILKMLIPYKTPVKLKKIERRMINGLEIELNCKTSKKTINPKAVPNAPKRKFMFFSCSATSPVN